MAEKRLVKIHTERGWEIWPNSSGMPLVAVFTEEHDADRFIQLAPDFQDIALKIAEAFPQFNLSEAPINPSGELVRKIARLIEQHWLGDLSKSEVERVVLLYRILRNEQREADAKLCIRVTDGSKDGEVCAKAIREQKEQSND